MVFLASGGWQRVYRWRVAEHFVFRHWNVNRSQNAVSPRERTFRNCLQYGEVDIWSESSLSGRDSTPILSKMCVGSPNGKWNLNTNGPKNLGTALQFMEHWKTFMLRSVSFMQWLSNSLPKEAAVQWTSIKPATEMTEKYLLMRLARLTLSLPSSKSAFSQPSQRQMYAWGSENW